MGTLLALVFLLVIGSSLLARWMRSLRRRQPRNEEAMTKEEGRSRDDPDQVQAEILRSRGIARELEQEFETVDASGLQEDPRFVGQVRALAAPDLTVETVLTLAGDPHQFVAALGLSALAARPDVPDDWTNWAIRALKVVPVALEPYVYAALEKHASHPVIGPALTRLDEGVNWEYLAAFIRRRIAGGELVDVETFQRNIPLSLASMLETFIDAFGDTLGPDFRKAFEEWQTVTIDTDFLTQFARIWERPFNTPPALLVGRRRELVDLIVEALTGSPRRSVLLVGEHGVGRTALARAALDRLSVRFLVFEATATQVNAGAVYIGQLEGRVKEIAEKLEQHDTVWIFPGLEGALYAGQHSRSPQGMLDALLPYVESGQLTLLAEVSPTSLERLLIERPRVASAFEVIRVRPLDESESVEVARHALEHSELEVTASDLTLAEAYELAQQFLPGMAAPGNLLRLVRAAAAGAADQGESQFDTTGVLQTLAEASGLPLEMLDPSSPLALNEVRGFFEQRVLGQAEAVDAVVERIAMVKAGLTDPTRPLGVFLFVGPTGTGKTELAKALAEFMFGSADRLVRLDMSEFQTPDALERMLSDTSKDGSGSLLIASVREDPFAVVLLDEFEKAAPPIWDLFLQVFDDGRLTDQQGHVVDFRQCVIILTSNIGSAIVRGGGVGFAQSTEPFRPERVTDALHRSFRPEFLNRIDRIVVFRPFERAQMRGLLQKELNAVLARRGLRSRPWAVELDDSAFEFIIEQGFTPELGARPLKRAVEQHLLAPLAQAIVEKTVPGGDQFLLVSAPTGERIDVAFVDPDDEGGIHRDGKEDRHQAGVDLDLRSVALDPAADKDTAAFLLDELDRIGGAIRSTELQGRKSSALDAINEPGFWERADRFGTIDELEYLDRLEAAFATASNMGERLGRHSNQHGAGLAELLDLLAIRLYVLDSALEGLDQNAPSSVFLRVRLTSGETGGEGSDFAGLLDNMYQRWASRRGMRITHLDGQDQESLCVVSGLGCSTILGPEHGIHVFEQDDRREDRPARVQRLRALVEVAGRDPGPQLDQALTAESAVNALARPAPSTVVRRYRRQPTPLVRDSVRHFRTGRLDRVLGGDFDLF